ncbi:MAG TPA: hypothetical protein VIT02_01980 [Burkholderiaceae bacterium]
MRALALVLLCANLAAFAWWQGWLDRWYAPQRDPGRVAAQVAPQKLRVVPLERLPRAATAGAEPCREPGAPEAAGRDLPPCQAAEAPQGATR